MFALDDLARLFNLTVREDAAAGGLTVTAGTQTIVLSTQQPLASVSGRMISLPAAPARGTPVRPGGLRGPRAGVDPARGSRAAQAVAADRGRRHPAAAHRGALGRAGPGTTRITIDIAPPAPHSITQERRGCWCASRRRARYRRDARHAERHRARRAPGRRAGVLDRRRLRFASFRASISRRRRRDRRASSWISIAQTETPAPGAAGRTAASAGRRRRRSRPPHASGLRASSSTPGMAATIRREGAQGTLEKNVTLASRS